MSSILERHAARRGRRVMEAAPTAEVVDLATPLVLAAVEDAQRLRLSWAQSPDAPEGEHVVRTSLEIVARYGWTSLRRVTWSHAQAGSVGHIAVGPGGVVVVDERLWTETVCVEGDVLRRGGFRCERELADLADAVATITALLPPEHRTAVSGVICVATRDLAPQRVGAAHVVGRLHLASHLATMEPRLDPMAVADVTRALIRALDGAAQVPAADADTPVWLPTDVPAPGHFLPAPGHFLPVPAAGPLQPAEPGPDRTAYFGSRPAPLSSWAQPTPVGPAPGSSATVPPYLVGQRWRAAAARVTIAVLVGLLTYQNSGTIATAVGDWMGTDVVTSVRAAD